MNYCTKCQSIYSQPGTCNCYAAPKAAPYIGPFTPYTYPTTVPCIPWTPTYPPFTIGGGSVTVTGMDGITWTGPVSIESATGPFSGGL
jgi:hypothetical protein